MAGCGQCPDQCSCVITDTDGVQYVGAGTADNPIVIPRALDAPWVGTSSDGSITITPGDVYDTENDGHAPDLVVNFCKIVDVDDAETGDLLMVADPADTDCRPHRLRDPNVGEVISRDPATGKAGWIAGVASFGGDMPYGVPLEFWGNESQVPSGYTLCDGKLLVQADHPNLFTTIVFNATGGAEPAPGMFGVPDKRGYVAAGRDDMGGTPANRVTSPNADVLGGVLGQSTLSIAIANMPAHSHGVTDPGHNHGVTNGLHSHGISDPGHAHTTISNGGHTHNGAGANRAFVVNDTGDATVTVSLDASGTGGANVVVTPANGAPNPYSSLVSGVEQNTAIAGSHTHVVTASGTGVAVANAASAVSLSAAATGITIQNAGAGTAFTENEKLQPTQFVNYILRTG